jgi:predicted TIM-barrel fold metal-dependent hydrolase
MHPNSPKRIISADCHINEPPHVFDEVPAALKDRAPKMMRGADGGDGWSFDGKAPSRTFGIEAIAGQSAENQKMSGLRFDQLLPGNHDGKAHAEDMTKDNVDVSVVYPAYSAQTYIMQDRELALACVKSYNNWVLGEFQSAAPGRLVGLPLLPVDDGIEICTAELDRCLAAGAKAAFIPGSPRHPYHSPYYAPLFARAEEANIPLTFHRTFGGKSTEEDWDDFAEMQVSAGGTVWRFFSAIRHFTYLVYGGVFERHPNLKIVAGEVNFGWLAFWMQMMEQNFDVRDGLGDETLSAMKRPTDYMGKNLFVTVLDDEVGFQLAGQHQWMVDSALWSSDYPHSVSLWPNSKEALRKLCTDLSESQLNQIASENAAQVYGV